MISFARNVRLIPIVLIAVACLFTLKMLGLMFEGGYTLVGWQLTKDDPVETTGSIRTVPSQAVPGAIDTREPRLAVPKRPESWAQKMFGFPDVTGSVGAKKPPEPSAAPAGKKGDTKSATKTDTANPANAMPTKPNGDTLPGAHGIRIPLDTGRLASAAERALLERLHERRQELDARARELEIRENLLKVAEKRLEDRVAELKQSDGPPGSPGAKKKADADGERFKNLVTIYENMKAKDAAKIFDRLELNILVEVATQINPRRMSDILAQMTPAAAERLTVELAVRAAGKAALSPNKLPKIGNQTGG